MKFRPDDTPVVLAGNPMLLDCTNNGGFPAVCEYSVFLDQHDVYTGKVSLDDGQTVTVDVSDVVSDVIPPYPVPNGDGWLKTVVPVAGTQHTFTSYQVEVRPSGYDTMTAYALPGRMPKQHLRASRPVPLIGISAPFLTTRSNGWLLKIPEDELMPLYFCVTNATSDSPVRLKLRELLYGAVMETEIDTIGIYALDVDAARRDIFDNHYMLSNLYELTLNDKAVARIIITEGCHKSARYKLPVSFLNTFEVPEVICLSGKISCTPSFGDDDGEDADGAFMRWDAAVADFERMRNRSAMSATVTIETDPIPAGRLPLLLDMLGASYVELYGLGPSPVKALPGADELNISLNGNAPQCFTLTFKVSASEMAMLPPLADDETGLVPRLFSDEFDEKFN